MHIVGFQPKRRTFHYAKLAHTSFWKTLIDVNQSHVHAIIASNAYVI